MNRIAIIGAGLAGLTAAYRLHKANLNVDVFEARDRVGGRVFTVLIENHFGKKTEVELGGQNITDGGEAVNLLALVRELSLEVQEKPIKLNLRVYFNGDYYDFDELVKNHNKTYKDLPLLANSAENTGNLIDIFCGKNAILKQALLTRITAYEGIDAYQQSIYHNIETLEYMLRSGLSKFHKLNTDNDNYITTSSIAGGNARLPISIAEIIKNNIHFNKVLSKVSFDSSAVKIEFTDKSCYSYDLVVLAIPASTFKFIDFSNVGIGDRRLSDIHSIQYGKNFKIAMSLNLNAANSYRSVITDSTISFFNHDKTIQLVYAYEPVLDASKFMNITIAGLDAIQQEFSNEPSWVMQKHYSIYKEPIQYHWHNDLFSMGSYSGYSTAISKELDNITQHNGTYYKTMFLPVQNSIFSLLVNIQLF
ncbi:MAG: FAD-dependent oxidoreductase [Candidatus Midichloria sp.]|nr:FAD-dependent oxidoreductase [Candidatus Midichloria sp.]